MKIKILGIKKLAITGFFDKARILYPVLLLNDISLTVVPPIIRTLMQF